MNNVTGYVVRLVTDVRTVLTVVTIAAGLFINSKIEGITEMLVAANTTLQTIERLISVDPNDITEVSNALNGGAQTLGEGVGEGGAEVVDRVGEAWNKFRTPTKE